MKENVLQRKKSNRCRLLFLGVDWKRKGGEIAFDALLRLEEFGVQAELVVCGCVPPRGFAHERMQVIPFLDKNDEKQHKELQKLFLTSDFFLLPTRSECYGMVFCEANAYGLPVITTDTGGVSGVIQNGENGFLLPTKAAGIEYARIISKLYHDNERYDRLVQSSRRIFDDRLNWDSWGLKVREIIADLR